MSTALVLAPNPLVDYLASASLRLRSITRVPCLTPIAGGKAFNMGRVLAAHGHRVVALGFAGGTTGDLLRELLAADGMEPALVPIAARTRLGFQAVDSEIGGVTALMEDGFAVTAAEVDALLAELRRRVPGTDLVLAAGSVPDATCRPLYRRVLDLCASAGVPCWLDAYGPALTAALAAHPLPAVVKPNRQEFEAWSGWSNCAEVHVTDGPRPILVHFHDAQFVVRPPRVVEVNPIGCGDSYFAALAHARLTGKPLSYQLRYAAAAGAANAARADVGRITPQQVEALVDQVEVSPLTIPLVS